MSVKENKTILIILFSIVLTIIFRSSIFSSLLYAQKSTDRSRILVDASSNNFPPMNSLDENENLTGFGREFADAVMNAVGVEVKHIHSAHWVEVLEWLDIGKADFIHDTGYTKKRDEFLDYSKPIIEMPEMIFVRPDQYDITGLHSLKDKKVACVNKHISHIYLQTFPEIRCYVVNTPVEGLYELISGKVDAFIYPEQIVLYLAQKLRLQDKIKTTGEPLRTLTWSMVVKEGNKEILELLNKGIDKVKQTGEYDQIYNKWWGRKFLAGYSKHELYIITSIMVVIAIIIVSLIALGLYNLKLRSKKSKLEKEISQRKHAENELRDSKDYLKAIYEAAENIAFVVTDLGGKDTKILDVSPGAEKIFHYTRDEVIGKKVAILHPQEVVEEFPKMQADLAEKTTGHSGETILVRKSGEHFPALFTIHPKFDKKGKINGTIGVSIDITERKIEEEKYKKTIESSIDGFWIVDLRGNFLEVNEAYSNMIGYSRNELLKMSILNIEVIDASEEIKNRIEEIIKDGSARFETQHRHKKGHIIDVEVSTIFTPDNGGMFYVFLRNTTEKNQMEERLRQAQKMESIGNLAGGIAHDFNNLLFPIIGMSEMLLEDLPQDSLDHQNAQEIYNAGNRAADLVKQILAFSRQSEHKMTPVRIQDILKEVLKLSRSTVPSNIEIQENIDWNCGLIMADVTQIHQVAMNLITNAFHAVEENNGVIDVTLKKIELGNDEISNSLLHPDQYIKLSVTDNGVGMNQSIKKKIFDPYFTTKKQGKGTGLGLAVVHGIIKEHNGDINVYSEEGRGSTFNIYLPLMKTNSIPVLDKRSLSLPTGTEKILLVDDEVSVAKLASLMLSRLGYQVTEKTNSADALNKFKTNPDFFDLVITDMAMPNMTGDQLAKELLSIKPDIPIIICTGFSERINKEHAEVIGIKGFLMKPVVKLDMAQMVRNVLNEAIIS